MAVTLDKPLKRELAVGTEPYMLTIAPDGLKLVPKGKRNGIELRWEDLVSGQAALAVALNASIERLVARDRRSTPLNAADTVPQAETAPATAVEKPRRGRSRSADASAPRSRARRRR